MSSSVPRESTSSNRHWYSETHIRAAPWVNAIACGLINPSRDKVNIQQNLWELFLSPNPSASLIPVCYETLLAVPLLPGHDFIFWIPSIGYQNYFSKMEIWPCYLFAQNFPYWLPIGCRMKSLSLCVARKGFHWMGGTWIPLCPSLILPLLLPTPTNLYFIKP